MKECGLFHEHITNALGEIWKDGDGIYFPYYAISQLPTNFFLIRLAYR